ncbi:MAG: TonB-dependent receptor [Gammaproteobacteria bacterium]|nr:TonB-dependent receptor [Gammaproteobacteria bacterium]
MKRPLRYRLPIQGAAALLLAWTSATPALAAGDGVIEEIIVTARQQQETLQDVPVTIAALTEEDIDRYNITNLVDAAKMVPNMLVAQGGSGNGANLRLRGVGSSSISAAFDQSVAINLDGVVVNRGRFIHNSYLDMGQLEILKGPQSLYFGKSATAGVISITTNDPGEEFEFQASAGMETEHDGVATELVISGPLSDTLGARLAVGYLDNDELVENYGFDNNPLTPTNGADEWFGDESLNARLTLLWDAADNLSAKLKYSYSDYESSGGIMWSENLCPDGSPQPTGIPNAATPILRFQAVDDCKLNGKNNRLYLNQRLRAGLPEGYDDGQAGLEQETNLLSLQVDWDLSDVFSLTSITGWVDLDHWELDDYSGGATVYGGLHNNQFESLTQEFQLASAYSGPLNFQAGFFYQDIEQVFDAYQYAVNIAMLAGPDLATGNAYDYNKKHLTDTEVYSAFLSLTWDINERTELTAGARYTHEEKKGSIEIPYVHFALAASSFSAPPLIEGLDFDDDNLSPEVALSYDLSDAVTLFGAYKQGFKSGGIDNSALPSASLNPANNNGDYSFLIYESEEAEGGEIGFKGDFLNGSMRLNGTAFLYEYSNLQVQLFESTVIQFSTFNASALETAGLEFDMLWQTDVEGLSVRGALAFTQTEYTDDFFTANAENLKGENLRNNAEVTGYLGVTYDFSVTDGWRLSVSADARYSDDYGLTDTLNPYTQDSFWLLDASVSAYSANERHELSVIGRNLGDEIYGVSGQSIPGRIAADPSSPNNLDQGINTQLGRTLMLRYRYSL